MTKKVSKFSKIVPAQQQSDDSEPSENPFKTLFREYKARTPNKLIVIDLFLGYCLTTAFLQILYVCLVGSFPKNSFLAGVLISIAMFVLGVALRKQINPDERKDFPNIFPERAYVDFLVAGILVLLVGVNYMG